MGPACPLCGNTDHTRLFRITADQSAQCWAPREQEPDRHRRLSEHIARLWGRDFADSLECRSCEFGFSDPYVAGDGEFYELAFGKSGYPRDKWEFRETLKVIEAEGLPHPRVLEVGAGDGYFLHQISPRFVRPADVLALEYNVHAIDKLKERGYRAEPTEVPDLLARGDQFGAVFMFQVLEHRAEPDELFSAFAQLVVPGGHFLIAVPNDKKARFGADDDEFIDPPPSHVCRWKPRHFAEMAERHGFELRQCRVEPFSLRDFLENDLVCSYMRRSQVAGTIANSLYARRKTRLGRIANGAAIALYAPLRVPPWIEAWRRRSDLGFSLWVHLVRK
jgi:2-polyprenyl-3-methyl-5-hydroxy-6-metoxy-1,4-benzoquinol methylase